MESISLDYVRDRIHMYLHIIREYQCNKKRFNIFCYLIKFISKYKSYLTLNTNLHTNLHTNFHIDMTLSKTLMIKIWDMFLCDFEDSRERREDIIILYHQMFKTHIIDDLNLYPGVHDNIYYNLNATTRYTLIIKIYLDMIQTRSKKDKIEPFILLLDYLSKYRIYLSKYRIYLDKLEIFSRFRSTVESKLREIYLFEHVKKRTKNKIADCYKQIFNSSINIELNRFVNDKEPTLQSCHRIFYDNLFLTARQNYLICFGCFPRIFY